MARSASAVRKGDAHRVHCAARTAHFAVGPIVATGRRTMLNAVLFLPSLLLLVVPPALVACGSSPRPSAFTSDEAGTGDGAVGTSTGGGNEAGPPDNHYDGGTLTGDASGMCQNTCSADGTSVVSCVTGQPIQTCASGQSCLMGQCVTPCGAAALQKSTIGCDYYAVDPDVIQEGQGACFAVYIANTSPEPVSINLENDNLTYDATAVSAIPQGDGKAITYQPLPNGQIPPGQIAIVFLTQAPNPIGSLNVTCPVTPAINGTDSSVHGTGFDRSSCTHCMSHASRGTSLRFSAAA